jgi:hypothetical protein
MSAEWIPTLLTATLGILALLYLLASRPWRREIFRRAFTPTLDLVLIAVLAGGILSVQKPELFDRAAATLVEFTDLPETLDVLDAELHDLSLLPYRTWERLKTKLGFTGDDDIAEPLRLPGPATTAVLPAIVELIGVMLRFFAYSTALLMGTVLLLPRLWLNRGARLAIERELRQKRLSERIDELGKRIELLSAETE